jgi:FlaA1/EpsC-like NDP-sugar epimerase
VVPYGIAFPSDVMIRIPGKSGRRLRRIPLVLLDAAIVYLAFVGGLKIRSNEWMFWPADASLVTALVVSIASYAVSLLMSGIYRTDSDQLHLDEFLKASGFLAVGGAVAVAVTYLLTPSNIPPRSVASVQFAFSLIGILGLRALIRFAAEWRRHPADRGTPKPPSVDVERFVRRKPIAFDRETTRNYLTGRTVLVTGAGGSVGSALSQQLLDLNPFRLVLVDVSEFNLFQLENALRGRSFSGELVFRIADIRDESIMRTVFSAYRPDIVFHAAAYKHVPLMERHPVEAFTNNTLATVSLVRICEEFNTEQFIFISSDKAVDPTSVLGATKRLAEWYIRSVDLDMRCKIVRFGNVMGSQGSVIPVFTEQILQGGPVTITHADMSRYMMTPSDATALILQSLLLDKAPVYTADMGEPILIADLARFMIEELTGSQEGVSIEYTGLRPGEKLSESLYGVDEQPDPAAPGVTGLHSNAPFSRTELDAHFRTLDELCRKNRVEEVRKALFQTRLDVSTASR